MKSQSFSPKERYEKSIRKLSSILKFKKKKIHNKLAKHREEDTNGAFTHLSKVTKCCELVKR